MPILDILETEARKWVGSAPIKERLEFLHTRSRSGENWLCVELGLHLANLNPRVSVELEVPYPGSPRKHCDLVLKSGKETLWVEVAHVWSWHQSKGYAKCKRDVERLSNYLPEANNRGVLLVFLISKPSWYSGEFERWINLQRGLGMALLIE